MSSSTDTPGPGSYTAGSTLLKAQQHRQHTTADTNTADGSASAKVFSCAYTLIAKYTFLALHSTGALPTYVNLFHHPFHFLEEALAMRRMSLEN